MLHHLESPYLQININPEWSSWSLYGLESESPFLEDVQMQVSYRMGLSSLIRNGQRTFHILEKWHNPQVQATKTISSLHGPLQQLVIETAPDINGIRCQIVFALAEQHPLFLWKMTISNTGRRPVDIERVDMLRAGSPQTKNRRSRQAPIGPGYLTITQDIPFAKPGSVIRPHPNPGKLAFFSNGWQTWSYTATYSAEDVYCATRFGFIEAQRWYVSGKAPRREPGRFISDMFGILGDQDHRTGILAGFLSQKQHFGSLETCIVDPLSPALKLWANGDRARLDPGAQMTTDWAVIQFVDIDDPDPLVPYLDAVARENNVLPTIDRQPPTTGWCSWYHFFQDIDEEKMRANLQSAVKIRDSVPLDLFQIDDGFESQIGDWFSFNAGFPEGVAPLAREIKAAGFRPGLWLGPFIVHSRSRLARQRPWLLRNRHGLPVSAGFQWNSFAKALDVTHPAALDYVREVVKTAVHKWGYPYLKLDFLYAAALKGRYHDRTKTRAQALRLGLEAIREAVGPEITLLGCGCPIGSGIGIFNAMRIGADVDSRWAPSFAGIRLIFQNEPNMPSARNAIQNTLTRAAFHNRWWANDPDCLLLRPDSQLTLAEVQSLATAIALSGGSLLLSDDLSNVPTERLRIAAQLLPLIGQRPRVLDWFDSPTPRLLRLDLENVTGKWHLLAVFNWEDDEQDITLPLEKLDLDPGDYFVREFWMGESSRISEDLLSLKGIPAHGVKLIALTPSPPVKEGEPSALYLGSNLHISQGLEVTRWTVTPKNRVRFSLTRPGESQGEVELYLPGDPSRILVDHQEVKWQTLGNGQYRFPVQFRQSAEIEVI
jgi:alpha-galactosidase